jgi:hypothetical protein
MSLLKILGFTNREIATTIWLLIFFIWALSISGVRHSIRDLLRTLFNKKIFIPLMTMLLYIAFMVIAFEKIHFWDISATKDTILWTLGSAFGMYFSLNKVAQDENYFKNVILDNLKIVLILEFVVNLYSFSLPVELIVIPIVSFIVLLNVFVKLKTEYKQVSKLLNFVLGCFGVILLVFTVKEIILDFQNFASLKNLRDFFLPPLFSIVLLPFIYIMALSMQYELFFVRINFANKNPDLVRYAKRKIISACHINLPRLNKVSKKAGYPKLNDKKDVLEWLKKERQ